MRKAATLRSVIMIAISIVALVGLGGSAAASGMTTGGTLSVLGTCNDSFHPIVSGGEAAWDLVCASDGITIGGWVKDTEADGKCAYIKAFAGNGDSRVPLAQACPKGTLRQYSWRVENTSEIRAYLYVA